MSEQINEIKRQMTETARTVKPIIAIILTIIALCSLVGVFLLVVGMWIIGVIFCIPLIFFLPILLAGIVIIQPEERIMIEFLGRPYCILRPGLHWIFPILMRKRMIAITSEQPLDLFPGRRYPNGVHIDLKGGGKTELVDPKIWIQMLHAGAPEEEGSILKMIYGIDDWIMAIQEAFEDALRTCLNNLTVEEVLSATHTRERSSWWEAVESDFPTLKETVENYGFSVKRLTISDFNWDDQVVKIRQEIFEEERSIEKAKLSVKAAENEVKQKAMELGRLIGLVTKELIQKDRGGFTKKEARETATEIVTYWLGIKSGAITDIRTSKGGELASSLVSSFLPLISKLKESSSNESS